VKYNFQLSGTNLAPYEKHIDFKQNMSARGITNLDWIEIFINYEIGK
jgi:hypothetical protein